MINHDKSNKKNKTKATDMDKDNDIGTVLEKNRTGKNEHNHIENKQRLNTYKVGQWNVRTLYQKGKLEQATNEMKRYGIDILGISEVRWTGNGKIVTTDNYTFLYSGIGENETHQYGVAILIAANLKSNIIEWDPINERIITMRINLNENIITVIQCYAPTEGSEETEKEIFYDSLNRTLRKINKKDIIFLMGDFNARVGSCREDFEDIIGEHGIGHRNENGELLLEICGNFELCVGGTLFNHKTCHKITWVSPDKKTETQIDHFCIQQRWKKILLDVRNRRAADINSDHHLIIAKIRLHDNGNMINRKKHTRRRNKQKLLDPNILDENTKKAITEELKKETENINYDLPIEELWTKCKEAFTKCYKQSPSKARQGGTEWMSADSWSKINERRKIKERILNTRNDQKKEALQKDYVRCSKAVKASIKKDKETYIENIANEAQIAADRKDTKQLYKKIRQLTGNKKQNKDLPLQDKNGKKIFAVEEQTERWREYFHDILNGKHENIQTLQEIEAVELPINTDPPTRTEIAQVLKEMKNGKAPGNDLITADILKVDIDTTVNIIKPIFDKIWTSEIFPDDWKEGIIVKMPKKGDISKCENWRGITLLNVSSKLFYRIILNRISEILYNKIRREQSGFRPGYSCIDNINTVRIMLEQSLEYGSPLQLLFIDYKRAFDSVNREYIWTTLKNIGLPTKIIRLIKAGYDDFRNRVLHKGQISEPFKTETGVKQGCILSPLIFLIVLDTILSKATKDKIRGIRWGLTDVLEDLDYADDVCLVSSTTRNMQQKVNDLIEESKKAGLEINITKTKKLVINNIDNTVLTINNIPIECVNEFSYLGSIITTEGGTSADIQNRIHKARSTFGSMRNIWRSKKLKLSTKIKVYNATIKPILLYGSETWMTTEDLKKKLQTFINRCLRNIVGVWWPNRISNEELWQRTGQESIMKEIKKRKYGWLGHTLRKPRNTPSHSVLDWNPQGKRSRGRPRATWRRTVSEETKKTVPQLRQLAQDRTKWKKYIETI